MRIIVDLPQLTSLLADSLLRAVAEGVADHLGRPVKVGREVYSPRVKPWT